MPYVGQTITEVFPTSISVDSATIKGDTTIGDASAADKKILFDGNAVDYHIGLDDSADSLIIGKGSALGTTTSMAIDANGIITKPLQPCFSATASIDNLALTTIITIPLSSERFDVGSNLASNTFTAPITGKYLFTYMLFFTNLDADHTGLDTHIKTSNTQYQQSFSPNLILSSDGNFSVSGSVLADMDINDTCIFTTRVAGGANTSDIHTDSHVSGMLIC